MRLSKVTIATAIITSLFSLMTPITAAAEFETTVKRDYGVSNSFWVNSNVLNTDASYEFNFTSDLTVKKKDKKDEHYDIDMSCKTVIGADGSVVYIFYAQEDFAGAELDTKGSTALLKTPSFKITYDFPDWIAHGNTPITAKNYESTHGYEWYTMVPYKYGMYFMREDTVYNKKNEGNNKTITSFEWKMRYRSNQNSSTVQFNAGDILGVYASRPFMNLYIRPFMSLYIDEHIVNTRDYPLKSADYIIIKDNGNVGYTYEQGTKQYYHDTVSITIDDVKFSKEIGNNWDSTDATIEKVEDLEDNSNSNNVASNQQH